MARRNSLSAIGIVNTITRATNTVAEVSLPYVDKSTFSEFSKQLMTAPEQYMNQWIDNLVNLCGLQIIIGKRMYESYFKRLYREPTLTENIALYMVDAIKAKAYDPNATSRILENEPPRVGVQYIQTVLKRQYQVTDIEDLLTAAFTTEGAFLSFVDAVTTQLYSSMEDDNVIAIKELVNQNLKEGNIRLEPLTKPNTQAELLSFMRVVKKIGADWAAERSREWNLAGFRTFSPNDDHYFLLNTDLDSLNQVYNLPWAFDKSYLEMKSEGEAIVMGSSALAGGSVYAMMFDKDFFQIRDRVNHPRFTSFFNPGTLSQNRFLTCFTVMSLAFFANAVAFIDTSAVASATDLEDACTIATRGDHYSVNPGDVVECFVQINNTSNKYFDKFGKYTLGQHTSDDTYIDPDSGELYIGKDERGYVESEGADPILVVTWTSHLNSEVNAKLNLSLNV